MGNAGLEHPHLAMTSTSNTQLYQVAIQIVRPETASDEEWSALLTREAEAAKELVKRGRIRGIWRVVGQTANVGIWEAESHNELHDSLASLPLFRFMTVTVTALSTHPVGDFTALPVETDR